MTERKLPGRMGLVMYARILGACVDQPRTPAEVAAIVGRGRQSVHEVLWRLEGMGCAHVHSWAPTESKRSMMQARFAAFGGHSMPYPRPLKRPPIGKGGIGGTRSELISFASVLRAMLDGATRIEIMRETGIGGCNLAPLLRELRKQGLVRICAWEARDGQPGAPMQVLQFAAGYDAPRPKRVDGSLRWARYKSGRALRTAGQRIVHAIAGNTPIVALGPQVYGRLGAGST